MSAIIAHRKEQKILDKLYQSSEPQLLAIYGRRRIGKTHLISQYFANKGIYFELTGSDRLNKTEQIINFIAAMIEAFPNRGKHPVPQNWTEALHQFI